MWSQPLTPSFASIPPPFPTTSPTWPNRLMQCPCREFPVKIPPVGFQQSFIFSNKKSPTDSTISLVLKNLRIFCRFRAKKVFYFDTTPVFSRRGRKWERLERFRKFCFLLGSPRRQWSRGGRQWRLVIAQNSPVRSVFQLFCGRRWSFLTIYSSALSTGMINNYIYSASGDGFNSDHDDQPEKHDSHANEHGSHSRCGLCWRQWASRPGRWSFFLTSRPNCFINFFSISFLLSL